MATVVVVTCIAALAGGCTDSGGDTSASSPPITSTAQAPGTPGTEATGDTVATSATDESAGTGDIAGSTAATTGVQPVLTTASAGTTGAPTGSVAANPWFPLEPGHQSVRLGSLNRGHTQLEHRNVLTVTNVTKEIDGVRAVLLLDQDFDGGEIAEQALDYLAVDAEHNVLYLGSYTEAYEAGEFVNAADAWLAGVKGAKRGTLVPGDPQPGSPPFTQIDAPGLETSRAEVVDIGKEQCVPFDCYTDVLVIREGDELKYFASGVGAIKTEPDYSGGEQEIEELINLTQLSAAALDELSAEALKLDQHARETAPDVFANSQPAELTS